MNKHVALAGLWSRKADRGVSEQPGPEDGEEGEMLTPASYREN